MNEPDQQRTDAIIAAMIAGYGSKFPYKTLDELIEASVATEEDKVRLMEPYASRGRYRKATDFLANVTSGYALGRKRYKLFAQKLIALGRTMDAYNGACKDKKIICGLSREDEESLLHLGDDIRWDILAEKLEKFSDQDTAAYADAFKLLIASKMPRLSPFIEAVHFPDTSEDNWGNVIGLTLTEIVHGHALSAYIMFCEGLLDFANKNDVLIPAFTHIQGATPTTFLKKTIVSLQAVIELLYSLVDEEQNTLKPFLGKYGGITGNYEAHFAAYPDIDWFREGRLFVESLGLYYESMQHQAASFVREAFIFSVLRLVNVVIIKYFEDFRLLVSCPAQFFVKALVEGRKGSSNNPGKTNLWACEGGLSMLRRLNKSLEWLSEELPSFVHEGDMGRSYPMREIGDIFSPLFIGLPRILKEIKGCVPNLRRIERFFEEYPAVCLGAMQYVLKQEHFAGDAYREIQKMAINPDGSYAACEDFMPRFEAFLGEAGFSASVCERLRGIMDPDKLVEPIRKKAESESAEVKLHLEYLREVQRRTPSLREFWNGQNASADKAKV